MTKSKKKKRSEAAAARKSTLAIPSLQNSVSIYNKKFLPPFGSKT